MGPIFIHSFIYSFWRPKFI